MSGCACVTAEFGGDCDGEVRTLCAKTVKAKVQHQCMECLSTIQPGEEYYQIRQVATSGEDKGSFYKYTCCAACLEVRKHFYCADSYWEWTQVFQGIIDSWEETGPPELCCFDGLSPAAVEKIDKHLLPHLSDYDPCED